MLCSFLLCWLCWCCESSCWLCLLWIFFIYVMYLIFVWGALLKVCWASPVGIQSCLSLGCPIVTNPEPSCSWGWFDDCCRFRGQLCDIWPILCLLWYVKFCSGLYVGFFPNLVVGCGCCSLFGCCSLLVAISSDLSGFFCVYLLFCCACSCCCWLGAGSALFGVVGVAIGGFGGLAFFFGLEPCFTFPCCVQHPLLLIVFKAVKFLLEVFCCTVVFVGYCSSVILKLVHWHWTLLVWHVCCSALGFVESHQMSLTAVCPIVLLLFPRWWDGWYCCFDSLVVCHVRQACSWVVFLCCSQVGRKYVPSLARSFASNEFGWVIVGC